jgi:hypothetical protein
MYCLYLLGLCGDSMPDWLIILAFVVCATLYCVAELRYSKLKNRIKELEKYKSDSIEWWTKQIDMNDRSIKIEKYILEEFRKLTMVEDDVK